MGGGVTLFHALPGAERPAVAADLDRAADRPAFRSGVDAPVPERAAGFSPVTTTGAGLARWAYRGGPWAPLSGTRSADRTRVAPVAAAVRTCVRVERRAVRGDA